MAVSSQSIPLNIAEGNGKTADADRMAAMLSRLGGRGYQVREQTSAYDGNSIDTDPDSDSDLEKTKPQQRGEATGYRRLTADVRRRMIYEAYGMGKSIRHEHETDAADG